MPACYTQSAVQSTDNQLENVNFNHSPKNQASPDSVDMGIILISLDFSKRTFKYYGYRPFTDFKHSLQGDIEEIITSRGYTFRGPYAGYDEITYSDKLSTDLVVEIEMSPVIQSLTPEPWIEHRKLKYNGYTGTWGYIYSYDYLARLSVSGKIKITFSEIMSHEKISIKNVEITETIFDVASVNRFKSSNTIPIKDPGLYNPLVKALEQVYQSALDKTWDFFDPMELKSWKPQIKELKERKRY